MIVGVGNEKVAVAIDSDAGWVEELGARRGTTVAGGTGAASASDRRYELCVCVHAPEPIVVGVSDEKIAKVVHCDGRRIVELCTHGGDAVVVVASASGAGDRRDELRHSVDSSDAVVGIVSNEQIAEAIERDAGGIEELGGGGDDVIAGVPTWTAHACNSGDEARHHVHTAHAMIRVIGDEQVAEAIHCDTRGEKKIRVGRGDIVTGVATGAVAGDRGDDAGRRIHTADAVIFAVGNEEIPTPVQRDAGGGHRARR